MTPVGEDVPSLRQALAAVDRRLAARTRARAALVAGLALALPAWALVPGAVGAAVIAAGAAAAGAAVRPVGGRAASWLDRHGADDELMISGAAAADGRVTTALAGDVITAADRRMTGARRPSRWPVLASALAIAGVALLVGAGGARGGAGGDDRQGPADRAGARVVSAAPGMDVRVDDPSSPGGERVDAEAPAGAVIVGGPRERRGAAGAIGRAAPGDRDGAKPAGAGPERRDVSGGGSGAGAGDRGAVRADGDAGASSAWLMSSPRGDLAASAPRAGARVEVAGVPPRYRALVSAYLERPAGGAR